MKFKSLLLASALFASPAFAQHEGHDMATMGHHVATPFEIAANKQIDALVAQVQTRPPSPSRAAIWGDIRDASKAKYANDPVAFDRFIKAAVAKLAVASLNPVVLTPAMVLSRTYGDYVELKRKAALALEPRFYPKAKMRSYTTAAQIKAAFLIVRKGEAATPVEIVQATAALKDANLKLADIIKRPTL